MTISTTSSKITYQGTGGVVPYPFPFLVFDKTQLQVSIYDSVTNSTTVLGQEAFTASGIGNSSGGTVNYSSSVPNTSYLTIERVIPVVQTVNLTNQDGFYPEIIERALDVLTMIAQQLDTLGDRAIRVPVSDLTMPTDLPGAANRANKLFGFDASGNPIATVVQEGDFISSTMLSVVAAATISAAQSALGLGAIGYLLTGAAGTTAMTANPSGIIPAFALQSNTFYWLTPANTIQGTTTLSVGGTGARPLRTMSISGIVECRGGEAVRGVPTLLYYDGTQYVIINPLVNAVANYLNFASGNTTDLGLAGSFAVNVTGTSTITSFGSSATVGDVFFLRFQARLQITYNATSMQLPGLVNITTSPDDTCKAVYLGSGNWRVVDYVRRRYAVATNSQIGTTYSFTDADNGNLVTFSNTGAITATLPATLPGSFSCWVRNGGAGTVTLVQTAGTVNGQASVLLPPGGAGTLVFDGVNTTFVWGGGRVLLRSISAGGVSAYSDTTSLPRGFNDYLLVLKDFVPVDNNVSLLLEVFSGSFQTSNYMYVGNVANAAGGAIYSSNSGSAILLIGNGDILNTGLGVMGCVQIIQPSTRFQITGNLGYERTGNLWNLNTVTGGWKGVSAVTGFRLRFSTGNIAANSLLQVYGEV